MSEVWDVTELAGQLLLFIGTWGLLLFVTAFVVGVTVGLFYVGFTIISDKYEVRKIKND